MKLKAINRCFLLLVVVCALALAGAEAQTPAGYPTLPENWVNNQECQSAKTSPNYTLIVGTGSASWTCSANSTNYGPYAATSAGLQNAVNNAETCRTSGGGSSSFLIEVQPTTYAFSSGYGLILPQSRSSLSSACIAIVSTADANLPDGQVVGAHGIQDNISESSDIGLNNPDLQGDNLSYQLGPSTVVTPATESVSASTQTTSSICPSSSACLTNFTITSGDFPTGFTVGTMITAQGFGTGTCNTSTDPDPCFDSIWIITSGGAGTQSLYAVPWGCYASVPFAPALPCTTGLTWTGGSGTPGNLLMDGTITGIYQFTVNSQTLLPIGTPSGITTAILPLNQNVVVPMSYGYVAPSGAPGSDLSLTVDTGSNQETVAAQQCANQKGLCARFTKSHAAGTIVTFCMGGCNYTLANGDVITVPSGYNDAQYMYKITNSSANPNAIKGCNPTGESPVQPSPTCGGSIGPDHWLVEDGIFSATVGNSAYSSPISIGDATDIAASTQMAANIHLAKIAAIGDWTCVYCGGNSLPDAIYMGCYDCSTTDTMTSQLMHPGAEGHSLSYGYGYWQKNNHNWWGGGSIDTLCGGFAGPVGYELYYPIPCVDMEWRRNRSTYPFSWLGLNSYGNNVNPYWTATFSLLRKDGFEIKEGNRWVTTGNIVEDQDISGGNYALTVRRIVNDSGQPGPNYANLAQNGYDAGNIYRNGCNGLIVQGRSNAVGSGGGAAFGLTNLFFENDLWYNISYDNNPGCAGALARGLSIGSGDVQWSGNITIPSSGVAEFTATSCYPASTDCTTGTLPSGWGETAISPGDLVQICGCTGNTGLNTPNANSCTSWSASSYPGLGTPALSPTSPSETTVYFATSQTNPDNTGSCVLSYQQGYTNNLLFDHISEIAGDNFSFTTGDDPSSGPAHANNSLLRDSILVGAGGLGSSNFANTTDMVDFMWNTALLSDDHTVWPGQTQSDYAEVCNNPYFSQYSECLEYSLGTGVSASTSYSSGKITATFSGSFSSTVALGQRLIVSNCANSSYDGYDIWRATSSSMSSITATTSGSAALATTTGCSIAMYGRPANLAMYMYFPANSCIGWVGSCSGSVPLTYPDYHSFALSSSSSFYAGNSKDASDGTSMGPNISVIDTDQTLNTFVCPWTCGSPGPYADNGSGGARRTPRSSKRAPSKKPQTVH